MRILHNGYTQPESLHNLESRLIFFCVNYGPTGKSCLRIGIQRKKVTVKSSEYPPTPGFVLKWRMKRHLGLWLTRLPFSSLKLKAMHNKIKQA